jgi:hypothetical protein
LQLREQAHVLDGDHRLVGEGLEQLDLRVAEWAHLSTSEHDRADGYSLAQERNAQHRAVAEPAGNRTAFWKFQHLGLKIRHMDRRPIAHRASGGRAANRRLSIALRRTRDGAMVSHQPKDVVFQPMDDTVIAVTQAGCALGHRVQHRLDVRGRARDDAQNLAGCCLLL